MTGSRPRRLELAGARRGADVGLIGVVQHVGADGYLWVRYNGGAVGILDPSDGPEVEEGEVVYVLDNGFTRAPNELLETVGSHVQIGVVREIRDDETLLETDGSFRWIPHAAPVSWNIWWTVEFDHKGIRAVLKDSPMRYRDEPPANMAVQNRFKVKTEDIDDSFDKIAGLDSQIAELRQVIDLMGIAGDLRQQGMRPVRGLLLAGESGTGKTMLARALAKEARAQFFHVRGPEIASKWVNESEEMLRALMDEADSLDRAIVFFDEIDSLGGARTADAHEMSNKLITQFLALLDGFDEKPGRALIVGATNRPEALDPTLLRSGRFDRRIDFTLPSSEARMAILAATRPESVDPRVDLARLAAQTESWCSADLRSMWTAAFQFAHSEGRSKVLELDCEVAVERIDPQVRQRRALMAAAQ